MSLPEAVEAALDFLGRRRGPRRRPWAAVQPGEEVVEGDGRPRGLLGRILAGRLRGRRRGGGGSPERRRPAPPRRPAVIQIVREKTAHAGTVRCRCGPVNAMACRGIPPRAMQASALAGLVALLGLVDEVDRPLRRTSWLSRCRPRSATSASCGSSSVWSHVGAPERPGADGKTGSAAPVRDGNHPGRTPTPGDAEHRPCGGA